MNCHKIMARFWCIVWDAQWVFKWTYLCLLLRFRTFSSWWYKFTDATHLVSKIMHQNLAVILWQFNYGKNSFIVLSRVDPGLTEQNSETSMLVQITLTYFERRNITVLMTYYLTCLDWTKQVNMLLMVRCRHSSVDSSALTILPPGFESQAHHLSFYHL